MYMVGPAVRVQANDFNSLRKGGDQKAALKPLSFLTRSHHHLLVRLRLASTWEVYGPFRRAQCQTELRLVV
jgi:hypothetical protein